MIKFGFCVPIFANPGMAFFRTPSYEKLDWKSLQDTVIHCEEQGYLLLIIFFWEIKVKYGNV